jgi:hypothetical protein
VTRSGGPKVVTAPPIGTTLPLSTDAAAHPRARLEEPPMDSDLRTRVAEHWYASERGDAEAEHAIYAADAVLDHPQSGERFRGRATIDITYDGVPSFSVSVMEFTGDQVSHESQYFGDAFEAAVWRAPLAEPIRVEDGASGPAAPGQPDA